MGAAIRQHIEVKDANGVWHHFGAPNTWKDYIYFGLLAGVRDAVGPIVEPRGLPDDLSFVTKFCFEQDAADGFGNKHVGWLSAEELRELQKRLDEHYRELHTSYIDHDLEAHYFSTYIAGGCVATHKGWEDARLVFWFDE